MAENRPYDQFAYQVLTASGSTLANPPAGYYKVLRAPDHVAENTTQLFLGIRFNCNKCHDHPFERWTQDQYYQFAAFFGQLRRKGQGISAPISGEPEYIWFAPGEPRGEVRHPVTGEIMRPKAPDAPPETIDPARDPRDALASVRRRIH